MIEHTSVLYNDTDPFVAAWLEGLIADGLLPPGVIDRRSITELEPDYVARFTQCHFFAGIGGWPYALQLAGWGERPVWTGSCPCQPLSGAGKRSADADERHLWPAFHRLIAECAPPIVFGEQVASDLGREWFAGIRTDLEELGYACGAADLCAASVGAPHIRQRLYWVADRDSARHAPIQRFGDQEFLPDGKIREPQFGPECSRADAQRVADAHGRQYCDRDLQRGGQHGQQPQDGGTGQWLEHAVGDGLEGPSKRGTRTIQPAPWTASVALLCADGKFRRVAANEAAEIEHPLFPLVDGFPNRMGTLRGSGNAIVPQVAAAFVSAWLSHNDAQART